MSLRIGFISDTHTQLSKIKKELIGLDLDLLVHCGDLTYNGQMTEVTNELRCLGSIGKRVRHGVILIAGNHDWMAETDPELFKMLCEENELNWLQDQDLTVAGLRFYGSAWTPEFNNWAFNVKRGKNIAEKWSRIPADLDVLVTHGPPHMILDIAGGDEPMDRHVGCKDLLNAISKAKPRYHSFGHVHHSYGEKILEGTHFINASICDEQYRPTREPIVLEI